MKRFSLKLAVECGVIVFAADMLLAVGSYLIGCTSLSTVRCGIDRGVFWITHHPVFSVTIWAYPTIAFFIGLFSGVVIAAIPEGAKSWLRHNQWVFALLLVVPLILAFALWGLPEFPPIFSSK
ncbi:MAG TPA: hypothetical protein PLV61_17995 [Parvularculaceae bacterium]|nr:hypothetical protein [Amphiplicatus sp.]HPE33094.1 hypothetical protein [Parvularculaceae bacterium]